MKPPTPRTQLNQDVLALRLEHAFRQLSVSTLANIVNGLILVAVFWNELDHQVLLVWLAMVYCVALLRYILLHVFRDPARKSALHTSTWANLFMLGAFSAGMVWGAAGLLLFHPDSIPHQIFLAFTLGGMVAGALPLLSPLPPAFALYSIPIGAPILLQLFNASDHIVLVMGFLLLFFMTVMLLSSHRFSRILHQSIELRLQLDSSIEQQQQQALLARMDPLTGIANRRLFDEALESEWKRAQRTHTHLSILIADIDHFKRYNDTLGHPAGDVCLKQVARCMATAARRPGDLVARVGGEEFAFLLPNTDETDAAVIAERVREEIKSLHLPHPDSPISEWVTISLGCAECVPNVHTTPDDLIQAADAALYRAKRDGRNQVAISSSAISSQISTRRESGYDIVMNTDSS